jgi:hypothetical protein
MPDNRYCLYDTIHCSFANVDMFSRAAKLWNLNWRHVTDYSHLIEWNDSKLLDMNQEKILIMLF